MRHTGAKALLVALGMGILAGVVGCEGGDGGDGGTPPSVDVTGTWVASVSFGETATLNMTQTGSSVAGSFSSNFGSKGTLSGSVSGNTVRLTLNETVFNRITTDVTGTVDGNRMSGTLSQSDGDSATFTATKR